MNNQVHFVHFTTRPGGIELKRPVLIANIKEYRFSVFVIRPPVEKEKNVYDGLSINVSYGAFGRSAYWYLFKYGRKNKKDIFHVFNIGPIALLILRLAGVRKLIYGIHGSIYWKTKTQRVLRKIIWRLAMSSNYRITSNSEFSGKIFREEVLNKTTPVVLYNPIDTIRFANPKNRNLNTRNLKIVYSGRLAQGKNLLKWTALAQIIHKKYPGFSFEIFGDGPLKETLEKVIVENNLKEFVSLKGFYKNPEEIYQKADLLLFLSEYESFGNVVIESILCKTPVIASAIPSMIEIFSNFPEFLVPLDDQLEDNVITKLEQYDELRNAAVRAAEEFRERFSVEQHINKVKELYASFNS